MTKISKKRSKKKDVIRTAELMEAMLAVPVLKDAWIAAIEAGAAAAIAVIKAAPADESPSGKKTKKSRKKQQETLVEAAASTEDSED